MPVSSTAISPWCVAATWIARVILTMAATALLASAAEAATGRRVALIVGVDSYVNARALRNPVNDAQALADLLRTTAFGFASVEFISDPDSAALKQATETFARAAAGADLALFYFAGHGVQINDTNFLLPTDARLDAAATLTASAVAAQSVIASLTQSGGARRAVVILDACRERPGHAAPGDIGRGAVGLVPGLAPIRREALGHDTYIAFATAPGDVALDGLPGDKHSPFTKALLRHLSTPGFTIQQLFAAVRLDLVESTRIRQVPWENHSLLPEPLILRPGNLAESPLPDIIVQDLAHWQRIRRSLAPDDFATYLKAFAPERTPEGRGGAFAPLATLRLKALNATSDLPGGRTSRGSVPELIRRMTALWIDDGVEGQVDNEARLVTRELGDKLGIAIEFVMAPSTESALELLGRRPFDVVISDMKRGEQRRAGYDLLERMRLAGLPTPFIVYSGSRKPQQLQEASDRGAQGATNHPVELLWLIARAVATR